MVVHTCNLSIQELRLEDCCEFQGSLGSKVISSQPVLQRKFYIHPGAVYQVCPREREEGGREGVRDKKQRTKKRER